MDQNLPKYGKSTSQHIEVVNLSAFGFWLHVDGREFFVSFNKFPWFRNATVAQICHIERGHNNHFHWPELDVDLDLQRIECPEQYPLVCQ